MGLDALKASPQLSLSVEANDDNADLWLQTFDNYNRYRRRKGAL